MGIINDEKHYLRSILMAGKLDDLVILTDALDMPEGYVEPAGPNERCDYLEGKHNCGAYSHTNGDFSIMIQANIWNWTAEQIHEALMTASTKGIAVAVPDDEGDANDFLIYIAGRQIVGKIEHDDIFDEVVLVDPKSEPKNLPRPDRPEEIEGV